MTAITTPPVLLTQNKAAQLVQPQTYVLGSVVIANLSPYALTVQVGARQVFQQPFTEALYSLDGALSAPIGLTPTLPAGAAVPSGTSAQAAATWYEVGQTPAGSWPVSLTAQAVTAALAGNVGLVAGTTVGLTSGTSIGLVAGTSVALANGTSVALAFGSQVTTIDYPNLLETGTYNTSGGINTGNSYNVSGYSAVIVNYQASAYSSPVTRMVTLQWFTNGTLVATETCSFLSSTYGGNQYGGRYVTATKGTTVRIMLGSATAVLNTSYSLTATFRPPDPHSSYFSASDAWGQYAIGNNGDTDGRDRFSACAVYALGAGGSAIAYPNTYDGPINFQAVNFGSATVNLSVGVLGQPNNRLVGITLVGAQGQVVSLIAPRRPIYVGVALSSGATAASDLSFTLTQ
jgi:hypothetical protein